MLPEIVICPNCSNVLKLNSEERESGMVHCKKCEFLIDFNTNPPAVKKPKRFVELFTCMNIGDCLLIKTILDDAEVDYYLTNENEMPTKFFIDADRSNDVKELLKNFELHNYPFSTGNEPEVDA